MNEQEPLADLAYVAISAFGILANFADDMRHLYRTEIAEVKEIFQPERVGSSTMPHKVNPKDFENVKSMWKAYVPRIVTVLMDQISEHQRDLTNSASMRYLAELFAAVDYGVYRTTNVVMQLEVDHARLQKNIDLTRDSIIAEPLYIILGLHRCPDPYDWSKKLVNLSRRTGRKITELLEAEPKLQQYYAQFTPAERGPDESPPGTLHRQCGGSHKGYCRLLAAEVAGSITRNTKNHQARKSITFAFKLCEPHRSLCLLVHENVAEDFVNQLCAEKHGRFGAALRTEFHEIHSHEVAAVRHLFRQVHHVLPR